MRVFVKLMDVFNLVLCLCVICGTINSSPDIFVKQKRKYRPIYHLTSSQGWMNNPAGITVFRRKYHIFYQLHPYNAPLGLVSWGHAISTNLVDWLHYPAALVPSKTYDRHGCLSGTALVNWRFLTLFYTGHRISNNVSYETQNIAMSRDGIIFKKYIYNPVIKQSPINTKVLRNPKVWRFRNYWYMILGTTSILGTGELLLYTSPDMFNWKLYRTVATSYGDMGYIWENPDLFKLNGHHVLLLSAIGIQVPSDDYRFNNKYQVGYVVTRFDYLTARFEDLELSAATFHQLDNGHDFYAPKTLSSNGRRILIAWMGMWENNFTSTTFGWAGMMTLPRELSLNVDGRILMTPIKEIVSLRTELVESAWYEPGEMFLAGYKSFELLVNSTSPFSDTVLIFDWITGAFSIRYSAEFGYISVDRGDDDGERRAYWSPEKYIFLRIFVDASSVEIFCGEGEVVFSSRIYPNAMIIRVEGSTNVYIVQYRLRRSVRFDSLKYRP
ncbi:raffinose invertase-like [Bicyclus anynana]|uniref:Sucrose-6-phosphate hydrolase n=1 Tax=Bicyclus anynana TaxID=110368 RepID=A0A6J1NNV3_BICAN|nr:raffinose invertase-like [Bicyclus anynana]